MNLRFLLLGIVFFCAGCASVPYDQVLPPEEHMPGAGTVLRKAPSFIDICERYGIDWQFDNVSQVVTMSDNGRQAKGLIGSQVIVFDGTGKLFLEKPLRLAKDGAILVPPDFQKKVLTYFMQKGVGRHDYALAKVRKIVIDAGHGGKDTGALGRNGTEEKDIVLDIAERLGKLLQGDGLDVIYTRKADHFISLQERTEIASKDAADLFVSIHANSSPEHGAYGVETFSLRPLNKIERQEKQREDNQRYWRRSRKASGNPVVGEILDDLLYLHKQTDSHTLAKAINDRLARDVRTKNRGTKRARFFVLRNTLVPAVLVEVGFLSNSHEEKNLRSNVYRQEIARSLAETIRTYVED